MKKSYLFTLLITFASFVVAAQTTPFPENFDGSSLPAGWNSFIGDNNIGNDDSWIHDAENNMVYTLFDEGLDPDEIAENWLTTPLFTVPDSQSILKIAFLNANLFDYGSTLSVMVSSTSGTNQSSFTEIVEFEETDSPMQMFGVRYIDLSAYEGDDIHLAFVMKNNNGDVWAINLIEFVEPTNEAPSAVEEPLPEQNSQSNRLEIDEEEQAISLSWEASSDADSETPDSYEFYIGESPANLNMIVETTETSLTLTDIEFDTRYYWEVRAKNVAGTSSENSTWNFWTIGAPNPAFEPTPEHEEINVPFQTNDDDQPIIELVWSIDGTDEPIDGIDIYFGEDPDNLSFHTNSSFNPVNQDGGIEEVVTDQLDMEDLQTETTYYWSIVTYNQAGESENSEVWEFTTDQTFSNLDFEVIDFVHYTNNNQLSIESKIRIDNIQLFDLNGKRLAEFNPNQNNFKIDLSPLSKGVYLAKIKANEKEKTIKFYRK
ncbi:MAG: choice-of-anchor J domain-containing protein [Bacteroidota bacterium]